ncbi:hypothetical protein JXC34_07115 [Candidatus Woesearchaeota archaeon]|nr:hypothetical protein [Candidatus Woesearchaeota archaeon]
MVKTLIFDSGPIISLAMNNLLWIIKPLKERFKGEFYITKGVKNECIDRPLSSKKFKFEALQTLKLIQEGTLKVYEKDIKEETLALLTLANSLFRAHENYVKNVQYGEIESVVAARNLNAEAVVIDEFITRTLIENPIAVKQRMEKKLHMKIHTDNINLNRLKSELRNIKVIRSMELVTVAYELGFFEKYYLDIPEPKKTLLDGLLWAIKLNGCSVSEQEIQDVLAIENM